MFLQTLKCYVGISDAGSTPASSTNHDWTV
nr:MAG TPA: hypothetical protein [Caudoviricetes sp.]DAR51551.1 MAG TPA: hypothetical protein [Caudoviricetes sp.]